MEGQPMTVPATEAAPGQTAATLGAPAETLGVIHGVSPGVMPLSAIGGETPIGAPPEVPMEAPPAGPSLGVPTPPAAPTAVSVPATMGSPVPAGPPQPPPPAVDQAQPMPTSAVDPMAIPAPPPPRTEFAQLQEQPEQPTQVPLQAQSPQDADMGSLASNLAQLEALQKEGAAEHLGTLQGMDAWSLPHTQHQPAPVVQASPVLPLVQSTQSEATPGVAAGLPPVPAPPPAVLQTGEGDPLPPPPAPLPPPPPAAPPEVKEVETDAAADDERPKLQEEVCFLAKDTTLNLMPSVHGNVLIPLTDGGVQYLLAGARGSTGIISGRYMFEAKIVEVLNPHDPTAQKGAGRPPVPKQVLRVGFATEDATLFLGENTESLCFDSEGGYTYAGHTSYVSERFFQYQVVSVVLNLDADSPNANSVSLFRDGLRASPPQPIPESMRGKPLFPAVTFRLQTVHVNFGPAPLAKMPFVCRTIQDAAVADVKVTTAQLPKDGKFDVLFPVFIPDEGAFDWLDLFLEKYPEYTELSDRKILEWAEKSGIWRPKGYGWKSCSDKPEFNFGLPQMDDFSVRRALSTFASVQQRQFIVMEVCRNLIKEDRKELLKRFTGSHFRKIAQIFVGEPTRDFKEKIHSILLKEKQEVANKDFRDKQAEELRKRLAEKAQRELERARRREERAQKKAAAALQKAAEEVARKAEEEMAQDGAAESQEGAGQKDASMRVEEKGEEEEEPEEEEDDDKMDDITEAKPPTIQLTDEEKKQWFRKTAIPDLMPPVLATSFAKFSMPMKEEGFDDVRYEWHKKVKCAEYVRDWLLNKKLTTRIEDLQPSEWFEQQWRGWQQQLHKWHLKKNEFDLNKKLAEARRRQQRDMTHAPRIEQKEEMKQEGEEPAPALEGQQEGTAAAETEAGKKDDQADKENHENKEAAKPKEEEEDEDMEDEDEDVFGIVDVCDVGKGEPLFAQFSWEDWALLSIRYELYLLVHAFRRDVNDAERVGIHTDHVLFYYNRYFQKAFNCKYFGVETVEELVGFIRDTVTVNPRNSVLEVHISDELDSYDLFLKLTEECRRERNLRIDSGNDSVVLKFNQQALTAQPPNQAQAFLHNSATTATTGGLRPYQRGARPPTAGRGYNQPPPQKQWYGSYSGSVGGGGYSGGAAGAYSGAVGGYSGNAGRAYSSSPPPSYGQKRPYLGSESGKGKYSRMA